MMNKIINTYNKIEPDPILKEKTLKLINDYPYKKSKSIIKLISSTIAMACVVLFIIIYFPDNREIMYGNNKFVNENNEIVDGNSENMFGNNEKDKIINGKEITISGNKTYLKKESLSVQSSSGVACERADLVFESEEQFVEKLKNLNFSLSEENTIRYWEKDENGILLCPIDYYYTVKLNLDGYEFNEIFWLGAYYGYIFKNQKDAQIMCVYNPYDSEEVKGDVAKLGTSIEKVREYYGTDKVIEKKEKDNGNDVTIFEIENPKGILRVETWKYKNGDETYTIVNEYGTEDMYKSRSLYGEYDRHNPILSTIIIEVDAQSFVIKVIDANITIDNNFVELFNFVKTNI